MAISINYLSSRRNVVSILLDFIALAFIYFVPTLSHLLNVPIYLAEPMRIMLILALTHTTRQNACLLALTLPLFSFAVSMHPSFPKMLLITLELVLNVWFFYLIIGRIKNVFASMAFAIILSKLVYYGLKFLLISLVILDGSLFSTPVYLQLIMTLIFSGYIFLVFRTKQPDPAGS